MSIILQPQLAFPLVRQIANHLDSNVYYVRAVVRDAQGDTIDTVNLASQGNQRYQASWQVPADRSGQGSYISIVTSVYIDSGYATKSPDYGDEETTYLIFDRVMPAMRGGGSNLDAYTVRRILSEELAKLPQPEKLTLPKAPEMRWGDVLASLGYLQDLVERIPTDRPDFKPVLEAIHAVKQAVVDKEVTPEADMKPMMECMDRFGKKMEDMERSEDTGMRLLMDAMVRMEDSIGERVEKTITDVIDTTEFVTTQTTMPAKRARQNEEERPKPINLSSLAS